MDVTPLVPKGKNLISAYGNDYIIVNQRKYLTPLIIAPDQLILEVKDFTQFDELLLEPEILLIGHHQVQMKVKIKAETMSFGAACRTYNVLLTEGREVACLLMSPKSLALAKEPC